MKIYISGPMTGLSEYNKPAFMNAERRIRKAGHEPVNPAALPHDHGHTWEEYMREDIKALMYCDAILLLDGWEKSKGAVIEFTLAAHVGIKEITWASITSK